MELKEQELAMWSEWKLSSSPKLQGKLIKSLDPLIQGQVNKYTRSNIPRPALEAHARELTAGAFKTYDPSKSQLNTHVTNHLKHLQRYVLTYQNAGKIPEHRGIMIGRFRTAKENLYDRYGREPTTTELGDALNWSPVEVERMELELRKDLVIGGEEEETFFDKDYHKQDFSHDLVMMAYWAATGDEKLIMEYTFGIGGKPKRSVSEISRLVGMPESQVRKVRASVAESISKASRKWN